MKRGFTLVEVLIVIAVIGVLAVMLFARMGESRKQTEAVATLAQLQEIKTAFKLYAYNNMLERWPFSNPHNGNADMIYDAKLQNIIHDNATNQLFPGFNEYISGYETPDYFELQFDSRILRNNGNLYNAIDYVCADYADNNKAYWSGINIRIMPTPETAENEAKLRDIFEKMNELHDGDDPGDDGCGDLRMTPAAAGSGAAYFLIGKDTYDTY